MAKIQYVREEKDGTRVKVGEMKWYVERQDPLYQTVISAPGLLVYRLFRGPMGKVEEKSLTNIRRTYDPDRWTGARHTGLKPGQLG